MKKELYFGIAIMAMILIGVAIAMPAPSEMTDGHLGLLMLSLVVVAIMLGFPTAFTLMGMGVIFTYFAYDGNIQKTLDLMVQSTYKVMTNDVLISVPLFVFMGYLVERANLIEKLFKSLHLAMARLPGALGVATLVTCAIFATATGIVGAVVTHSKRVEKHGGDDYARCRRSRVVVRSYRDDDQRPFSHHWSNSGHRLAPPP